MHVFGLGKTAKKAESKAIAPTALPTPSTAAAEQQPGGAAAQSAQQPGGAASQPAHAMAVVAVPAAPAEPAPLPVDPMSAVREMHALLAENLITKAQFDYYKANTLRVEHWTGAHAKRARACISDVRALHGLKPELIGQPTAPEQKAQSPQPAAGPGKASKATAVTPAAAPSPTGAPAVLTLAGFENEVFKVIAHDPTAGVVKLRALVEADRVLAQLLDPTFVPRPPDAPDASAQGREAAPAAAADDASHDAPQLTAGSVADGSSATNGSRLDSEQHDGAGSTSAQPGSSAHALLISALRMVHRSVVHDLPTWGRAEAAEHEIRLADCRALHALWLDGTLSVQEYGRELERTLRLQERSAAIVRTAELRALVALRAEGVLDEGETVTAKRKLLELDSPFTALGLARQPAARLRPKSTRELYLAAQLHALQPAVVGGLVGPAVLPQPQAGKRRTARGGRA